MRRLPLMTACLILAAVFSCQRPSAPVTMVAVPYADLHAGPTDRASRVSQLLYGEQPAILARKGSWLRVRGAGGDVGWLRSSSLSAVRVEGTPGVVAVSWLRVAAGGRGLVLPMGALVRLGNRSGRSVILYLNEQRIPVPGKAVRTGNGSAGPREMLAAARLFLGSPYLWGGMTGRGIDCSGLVHVAARVTGLRLPRDARRQFQVGRAVKRADLRPGDLVFYTSRARPGPSHVALYVGSGRIIQAVSPGGVCLAPVLYPSPSVAWYGARRIFK